MLSSKGVSLFVIDDVIKWKHFMRYWWFVRGIHRSPVNSPHKGQWRGALMFSLIRTRINGWVNSREAETLSRLLWRHCNEQWYTMPLRTQWRFVNSMHIIHPWSYVLLIIIKRNFMLHFITGYHSHILMLNGVSIFLFLWDNSWCGEYIYIYFNSLMWRRMNLTHYMSFFIQYIYTG